MVSPAGTTTRRVRVMAGLVFAIAPVFGAFTASAPAVPQAAPRSTSPPTIEGEFREGQTLRAGNGIWANNPTSFTYQWQRCDSTGLTNCRNIQGATNQRYELRQADVGRTMRVLVTARNADGSTTANSTQSEVVAEDAAPRNTALPTITGTPMRRRIRPSPKAPARLPPAESITKARGPDARWFRPPTKLLNLSISRRSISPVATKTTGQLRLGPHRPSSSDATV